jgi:hypothetical protein
MAKPPNGVQGQGKSSRGNKGQKKEQKPEVIREEITFRPHPLALGAVVVAGVYGTAQAGIRVRR